MARFLRILGWTLGVLIVLAVTAIGAAYLYVTSDDFRTRVAGQASTLSGRETKIADLTEREGRALVFVLAKWDLIEDQAATLAAFREHAERMLPQVRGAPVVALSGETGSGVNKLMPAVLKIHKDWSTKVKTRDLNDWLQMAMQRHPPPAVSGRRVKPKYMAQTKARPPTFVLFSSRADQMPEHYRRYLVNSLRESFDLPGTPIRITIKSGANPFVPEEDDRAPDVKKFGRGGPAKTYGKPQPKPRFGRGAAPAANSTRVGVIKPRTPGKPRGR